MHKNILLGILTSTLQKIFINFIMVYFKLFHFYYLREFIMIYFKQFHDNYVQKYNDESFVCKISITYKLIFFSYLNNIVTSG